MQSVKRFALNIEAQVCVASIVEGLSQAAKAVSEDIDVHSLLRRRLVESSTLLCLEVVLG